MKTLFYIALVAASLWFIQFGVNRQMKSIKTHEVGKINRILFTDETFDITFWGSSTTQNHFNDSFIGSELNLKAFNFGINGTSFDQYQGLLNNYIEKADSGEIIVIGLDIHGLVKRNALYQPYYYIHTFSNDKMYESLSAIDKEYVWKGRFVPFYRLIQYGKHNFSLIKNQFLNDFSWPTFGFLGKRKDWQVKRNISNQGDLKLDTAYLSNRVMSRFENSISEAIKNKLKIIIVITPMYKNAQNQIRGLVHFRDYISRFRSENVIVLDYLNHEICKKKSNFFNNTHMNTTGAKEFSIHFSHMIISEKGFLE